MEKEKEQQPEMKQQADDEKQTKKRGKAGQSSIDSVDEEKEPEDSPTKKGGKRPAAEEATGKGKKAKAVKIPDVTDREHLAPREDVKADDDSDFKVVSFNVNGLRGFVKKCPTVLSDLVARERPHLVCIQETKLQEKDVAAMQKLDLIPGWDSVFSCSQDKKGYSGTAIFFPKECAPENTASGGEAGGSKAVAGSNAKQKKIGDFFGGAKKQKKEEAGAVSAPKATTTTTTTTTTIPSININSCGRILSVRTGIDDAAYQGEGRSLTVEYASLFVVALYVPNSGQKLERLQHRTEGWDLALRSYVRGLEEKEGGKGKPVLVVGDLNVAHRDIDIYNYSKPHIKKQSGCTAEERDSFSRWLGEDGVTDAFRHLHGDKKGHYTWWSMKTVARPENKGFRLDYGLLTTTALPLLKACWHSYDVQGSDHCPIHVTLSLPKAKRGVS